MSNRSHIKHEKEAQAIALLERVIAIHKSDGDALPGSVVSLVKQAATIMKKRRKKVGNEDKE